VKTPNPHASNARKIEKRQAMEAFALYIPQDRRIALARGEPLPDRTYGSALFADISGFTPLAESLAQSLGTQRGAEELTRQLNLVYDALISQVHSYRGSVIGFVGDAITCWFNEMTEEKPDSVISRPSSVRATACALAMQTAMRAFPHLAIKIGIATGPARRFIVGDPGIQLIDTLTGETIRQMAQAESLAEKGGIVVAASTATDLTGLVKPVRSVGDFTVIAELTTQVEPIPWDELPDKALTQDQIRSWVLPSLYERIATGQERFTTELRAATALFVQFQGIDYDRDEDAGKKLDGYIRQAQAIVQRYDGNMLQLTIGDKGSFFYAVFGAPIAHDDDPMHAVQAALELNPHPNPSPFETGEGVTTHIGIATGQMRVGAYGAQIRNTYGAIGDATNLAARLMQAAPSGEIRCDYNVYHSASKRIAFETLSPIRVKGKAGLVRVYRPTSRQSTVASQQTEMIGRRAEIATVEKMLDEVQGGAPRVLIIEGEAGIGKSRLVDELKRLTRERGLTGLVGNGQSIEQYTPYRAWRDVFNSYFDLDNVTDADERRAHVESLVAQLIPEHAQRLPVLNDVLGLGIPENELTQLFDANRRQQNVTLVLTALLRAWTNEHPLVLILEDAHWLDGLSWNLAIQIVRSLSLTNAPLLFVLVNRPLEENSAGHKVFAELRGMKITQSLALSALAPEEIVALIANRLNVAVDALPAPLVELVQARANGNPFFAEELVFNLRDTGVIKTCQVLETWQVWVVGDLETAQRTLPDTLHGLILSRIDRLPPQRQFVVKVAAVIGRAFAFAPLHHVVTQYMTMMNESLKEHLTSLTKADFTFLETLEPELTYLFKHIITQEAAYQTLLFEQRRELHCIVAEWYEDRGEGTGDREQKDSLIPDPRTLYPLLAYHYRYAEDAEKEKYYLKLAGEAAEKVYANDAAIGFYTRLLDVIASEAKPSLNSDAEMALSPNASRLLATTNKDQSDILLKRGTICELVGRWKDAEQDYRAALKSANDDLALKAKAQVLLGKLNRLRGNYGSALEWLSQAQAVRTQLADAVGLAQVVMEMGVSLHLKGEHAQAREIFSERLALARAEGNLAHTAGALNNLGILVKGLGDNATARALYEETLSLRRQMGDKLGIAGTLTNLGTVAKAQGNYAEARALYEESLSLWREMGDKYGIATSLSNLGSEVSAQGNNAEARVLYEESLRLRREMGDKHGIAVSLNNLGILVKGQGDYATARVLYEESLRLRREINDKQGIATSLNNLGILVKEQGDYATARALYEESLSLRREINDKQGIASSLVNLGLVALEQGDCTVARALIEESLSLQRGIGNKQGIAASLHNLGNVAVAQNDNATARVLYEESLSLRREMGDKSDAAYPLLGLGLVALAENQPEARAHILHSLRLRQEAGTPRPQTSSLVGVAGLVLHEGNPRFAAQLLGVVASALTALKTMLEPDVFHFHAQTLAATRATLTQDEFDTAWAQGAQMTLDQAIDEALKATEGV
jgi:predicted ATPase/class 3 adenylate cyclase